MLYLLTWRQKSRKEKAKDVARMVIFVIVATTAIALMQAAVKKTNENIAQLNLETEGI